MSGFDTIDRIHSVTIDRKPYTTVANVGNKTVAMETMKRYPDSQYNSQWFSHFEGFYRILDYIFVQLKIRYFPVRISETSMNTFVDRVRTEYHMYAEEVLQEYGRTRVPRDPKIPTVTKNLGWGIVVEIGVIPTAIVAETGDVLDYFRHRTMEELTMTLNTPIMFKQLSGLTDYPIMLLNMAGYKPSCLEAIPMQDGNIVAPE